MRRTITLLMLIAILCCNGIGPAEAQPSGDSLSRPDALNWIARWKGEHDRERLVRETAREFELLNPGLRLNMKFHQELGYEYGNDVSHIITQMIRSGRFEWDVVPMNTGVYRAVAEDLQDPFWGRSHLVDFLEVRGFWETQKPFILTDPTYAAEYGGMMVGPYIEGFYTMLWYNRKVAERIGLDIKQFDMSFDDFCGYIKSVQEYNRKNNTHLVALYEFKDWVTTYPLFQHFFKSALGNFKEAQSETFSEDKQNALFQALRAFERLGELDPLPADHDTMDWSPNKGRILDGEGLFTVNGSWMYSHWMDIDPARMADMAPAELPALKPVDHYIGSFIPQFAVMKNAPHAKDGTDLLMFWSRPSIAEKWVRYTKAPTGLQGNLTSSDMGMDPISAFNRRLSERYQGRFHFTDNAGNVLSRENRLLAGLLEKKLVQLLTGRITAEQAMAEIMAQRR